MQAFDFIEEEVALAELTTLGVGGPARYFARCCELQILTTALNWARKKRLPILVLGGGSNVLVADTGFDGLCVQWAESSIVVEGSGERATMTIGAGAEWDLVVARAVDEGLGGIECLSGIPGWAGAAPVQNIGAYGQEVGPLVAGAQAVDLTTGAVERLSPKELDFGYRWSRLKGTWRNRFVITRLDLELPRRGVGTVRYPDLRRRFGLSEGSREPAPALAEVRQAVLEIRSSKSMVLTPEDPNRRSAGSFFVNPVVADNEVEIIERRLRDLGIDEPMPSYPAGPGRRKLSAAFLIERAGFPRGWSFGPAGLSTQHTLALINRGGATARDLLAAAREVRGGVQEALGVKLTPEPVFVGFSESVEDLLGIRGR